VNQINPHLQEWIIQEAHGLRVVSAFTKLIKPLSNCPGLSESQQIDFTERIDTPDMLPNDIHILEGIRSFCCRIVTPVPVWRKVDVAVLYK
jgi:hypothetical protein